MIVLGIDPGPEKSAWALLEVPETGKAKVVECGLVFAADLPIPAPDLVAIEKPEYVPIGGKKNVAQSIALAQQLVETAWLGGRIYERLGDHYVVVTHTAGEVRKKLLGRPSCNDRELKWALSHFVDLPKRSNCHTRDAMAVAIAAYRLQHACPDGETRATKSAKKAESIRARDKRLAEHEAERCAEWDKTLP
jgi:Holliday junction resolvasome RuvABC endonuclease subunit